MTTNKVYSISNISTSNITLSGGGYKSGPIPTTIMPNIILVKSAPVKKSKSMIYYTISISDRFLMKRQQGYNLKVDLFCTCNEPINPRTNRRKTSQSATKLGCVTKSRYDHNFRINMILQCKKCLQSIEGKELDIILSYIRLTYGNDIS